MQALGEQVDFTRSIVTFSLIMGRVMAIVVLVPFLGGKNAPPEVKMGIGVTLTMVLWPTVAMSTGGEVPITPVDYVLMMLKEVFVGLAIGFVAAEIFYVVEMAGQLIDLLRGTNQIQLQVPEITERSSAFGALQYQLLLVLFLSFDLHHIVIESLFESFVAVPINQWPGFSAGYWSFVDHMMRTSATLIFVSVSLSVPIAIVCLIVEVSFGLLNRVAPQINAYFMAMPAKVIAGVGVFFFASPLLLEEMLRHSWGLLGDLQKVIALLE